MTNFVDWSKLLLESLIPSHSSLVLQRLNGDEERQ